METNKIIPQSNKSDLSVYLMLADANLNHLWENRTANYMNSIYFFLKSSSSSSHVKMLERVKQPERDKEIHTWQTRSTDHTLSVWMML